jgi:hypothetical protein
LFSKRFAFLVRGVARSSTEQWRVPAMAQGHTRMRPLFLPVLLTQLHAYALMDVTVDLTSE